MKTCLTIYYLDWLDRTLIWIMPKYFVWSYMGFPQNLYHMLTDEKMQNHVSVPGQPVISHRSTVPFNKSLQVIKHWFISTTLKQSNSLLSVQAQHLHTQRRPGKFIHMWRSCRLYFSTFMEFCIINVFQKQELWTNIFTHMFCSVYGEMWGNNAHRIGVPETGLSFT
jgi:hypothetical protein